MRRPSRVPLRLLAVLAGAALGRTLPAEEEHPLAAPVRAILLQDDAGLRRVYDGVRKGLEFAQLPRVELETLADSPEAFAAYARRVAESPPPLLFLVGRRAAERALAARIGGARVFVDTALAFSEEDELPAALRPEPPAAVVRGLTPVTRWRDLVRGVLPGAAPARVGLAWRPDPSLRSLASRLAEAVGLAPDPLGEGRPAARWSLRAGAGEVLLDPAGPDAPLLSDDLGHWGKGAAVLLLPDHPLVGRTAAEAGRRLLTEKPPEVIRLRVGATEIRVDLDAARASGLDVPLSFAASADVLRGERRR